MCILMAPPSWAQLGGLLKKAKEHVEEARERIENDVKGEGKRTEGSVRDIPRQAGDAVEEALTIPEASDPAPPQATAQGDIGQGLSVSAMLAACKAGNDEVTGRRL